MPQVNVIDWWSSVQAALDSDGKNGSSTPNGWAHRRSVANAESKLKIVLFRSLHALHHAEAKIGNFSTFSLLVDTTLGSVKVTQVDESSPLGSPFHAPEVFSMYLRSGTFGAVPPAYTAKSRSWAFGIIVSTLLGASPPWSRSCHRQEWLQLSIYLA